MNRSIQGITKYKDEKCTVVHIDNFSDELKDIIRKNLATICHGAEASSSARISYDYKNTLKEFVRRYKTKPRNLRIGMMGEMMTHVLILEIMDEYSVASPYFNTEERNIKKGFDVLLFDSQDHLWITEIKSGEIRSNMTVSSTTTDLLNDAKTDLNGRLNNENVSLWMNAVNGANLAIKNNDAKAALISILHDRLDESTSNKIKSQDIKVVLTSVLFADLSQKVNSERVIRKHTSVISEKLFKDVYIISIQKESYIAIWKFLNEEVLHG